MGAKLKYSKIKSFLNYLKPKGQKDTGFEIIFGSRGVGKSTYLAKIYLDWLKIMTSKKRHSVHQNFYSNLQFNIVCPQYHYLDLGTFNITDYFPPTGKFLKYHCCTSRKDGKKPDFYIQEDSIILVDEIGIIHHARNFSSMPQELINFTKVVRHLNIKFICCSQQYDIDKALRQTSSSLRLMSRIGHININRKIKKYIAINSAQDGNSAEQQIVDRVEFCPIFEKDALRLSFIPFYTDLFDSFG